MLVKKLLLSPALDDEFFTHLSLADLEDAAFVAELRLDPMPNRHIDRKCLEVSVDSQRKWIKRYKACEAIRRDFSLIIRHQMKDFGAVRIHDIKDERGSFQIVTGS